MTVVSKSAEEDILFKVILDLPTHAYRAKRHVRACQSLRHRDQIGHDFPVVDREPLAGATEARHHFIGDKHDAVLVTQIAQSLHVSIRRNQNAVCSNNRFDDQCGNSLWTFELEHFFCACENVFSCVPTFLNAVIEIRNTEDSGNSRLGSPTAWVA